MSLQHSGPGVLTLEILDWGWVGESGDGKPVALQAPWGNVPHGWKAGMRIVLWVKFMVPSAAVHDFLSCSNVCWINTVPPCCCHSLISTLTSETSKDNSSKQA